MTDELKNKVETDLETALKDLDHSVGKVAEDNVRDARPGNWTPQQTNPPAPLSPGRAIPRQDPISDVCRFIARMTAAANVLNGTLNETLRLIDEVKKLS